MSNRNRGNRGQYTADHRHCDLRTSSSAIESLTGCMTAKARNVREVSSPGSGRHFECGLMTFEGRVNVQCREARRIEGVESRSTKPRIGDRCCRHSLLSLSSRSHLGFRKRSSLRLRLRLQFRKKAQRGRTSSDSVLLFFARDRITVFRSHS